MSENHEPPVGWSRRALGEVLSRRTERATGKEPLLSVTQARGVISQKEVGRRDSSSVEKGSYWRVHQGDIVYNTMRMWQGVSGCSNLFGIVSPAYTVCEPSSEVWPQFLAHLFKHPGSISKFYRLSQGLVSDTWNLKYSAFARIEFAIPPKDEQRRIAEVLDFMDDQIGILGELAGKLQARREGLFADALAAVVADEIPLGSCLTQSPKNGYSPKEVDEWTGLQALGLGCLAPTGFEPRQLKNMSWGEARNSAALLSDGDLLMSRANTRDLVGLVGVYRDVGTPCIYPDLMMRLSPRTNVRAKFLELALRSSQVRRRIQGLAQGTSETMVKISGSAVQDLLVKVPDLRVQDEVLEMVSVIGSEIDSCLSEKAGMSLLKKGLMNDLLTGQVRVSEAGSALDGL